MPRKCFAIKPRGGDYGCGGGPVCGDLGRAADTRPNFADSVTHDKEPLIGGAEGLEVTRAACAIEESAQRAQPLVTAR